MKKIVVRRAGGYERLVLEEAPEPELAPGEVLVDVQAAGVNYADCVVRMGLYASARQFVGWPITPGFDLAGQVREVGSGVKGWRRGDACLGVTFFGAYATRVAVPAELLRPCPEGLSATQAAALPTIFLTAWYALHEQAAVRPGARVLVHSAAGGVGGALLQLGRAAGCRSLGVVGGAHKVSVARELGADEIVNKHAADLWAAATSFAPEGFDAVFDANGTSTLRRSYAALAPQGRLVVYGHHSMLPRGRGRPRWGKLLFDWLRTPRFSPLDLSGTNRAVLGFNLSFLFGRRELFAQAMDEVLAHLAAGRIRVPPIKTYPLADAAGAQRALETGDTVGKLVLICGES